jgi:hypothetical protein
VTSFALRAGAVAGIGLAVATLAAVGGALPVSQPRSVPPVEPDGRTVTVCPPARTVSIASATTWGTLGVRTLTEDQLRTVATGSGFTWADQTEALAVVAEGRQALNSAASAYAKEGTGRDRGLSLTRCTTPVTSAWFTGLWSASAAEEVSHRSEVLLINPDVGQAEVDLRFFGPHGLQVAAGGRGIAVPARSVRAVALDTLFTRPEPVGLHVRTTTGRVVPVIRQYTGQGVQSAGSDWQVATTPPATGQVVPGIPGGPGPRTLVLTNPGSRRTTATVEALGTSGTFAPVDAGSVDINAESTTWVSLAQGLNGEPGAVRITADQPVITTVSARSADGGPDADIAMQSATRPLTGTALAAVAGAPGTHGEVLVSNAGAADVVVPLRLVGTDGIELSATELIVAAGTTARWEVGDVEQPASVHLRTPDDTTLYAGVLLTSTAEPAGGLGTTALSAAWEYDRELGGEPAHDPGVAR